MRWLWNELVRPRGRKAMPFAGAGRRRSGERGLALLMVMGSIAIITVITVELSYDGRVRLVKSSHERDKVAARYLAESGANIYRLILVADQQISGALGGMMPEGMNVQGLWQMLPAVNTGLMRMLFTSGGSVDDEAQQTCLLALPDGAQMRLLPWPSSLSSASATALPDLEPPPALATVALDEGTSQPVCVEWGPPKVRFFLLFWARLL